MFVTKKSSIERQLKDKEDDHELLADIIERDDVERWVDRKFTDREWKIIKTELEKRYDYEIIDWVKQAVIETFQNMGKS